MGHHKIRNEKNCLNCGTHVEDRFCSHCGQENIDTRHPFHYLIGHFVEDLTHYDSSFWKTIKYLLFNPGKLTKEYLAGKRMSYVPPVKLYIFISFITFFLLAILPSHKEYVPEKNSKETPVLTDSIKTNVKKQLAQEHIDTSKIDSTSDDIERLAEGMQDISDNKAPLFQVKNYDSVTSVASLDSIHNSLPKEKKASWLNFYFLKKYWTLKDDGYTNKQIIDKWIELQFHNIPKAIFCYLPFFAFWLWLFHNKKKWYYFDHGIFSLHYFAFLLAVTTVMIVVTWICSYLFPNVHFLKALDILFIIAALFYIFFYFFRAHSRVYKEQKIVSRFKGVFLFFINMTFIIIFLTFFAVITTLNIH